MLWIVIANLVAIPAIHLSVSWFFTRRPLASFDPGGWLYRVRRWERRGDVYETVFGIRSWKEALPDAAPWFGGFAKKRLESRDPEYLKEFGRETCRSEAAHWAQVVALFLPVAWNPWPASVVLVIYAFLSNLPCILLQRYNRARLMRTLERTRRPQPATRETCSVS